MYEEGPLRPSQRPHKVNNLVMKSPLNFEQRVMNGIKDACAQVFVSCSESVLELYSDVLSEFYENRTIIIWSNRPTKEFMKVSYSGWSTWKVLGSFVYCTASNPFRVLQNNLQFCKFHPETTEWKWRNIIFTPSSSRRAIIIQNGWVRLIAHGW